jgi:hypothetical protein
MRKTDKWTIEEVEEHIKVNVKDYGAAVVVGALFAKIYGDYPKIGLSGFQAQAIDTILKKLPEVS